MILLTFRKMLKNKWLMLCLFLGALLAVTTIASIPMYSDAVLQRTLLREMEKFQIETGTDKLVNVINGINKFNENTNTSQPSKAVYPGQYKIASNLYRGFTGSARYDSFNKMNEIMGEDFIKQIDLPVLNGTTQFILDMVKLRKTNRVSEMAPMPKSVKMRALYGWEDDVQIVNGRMPSSKMVDGTVEVMVMDTAEMYLDIFLNDEFELKSSRYSNEATCKLKVVGIFKPVSDKASIWYSGKQEFRNALYCDFNLMKEEFLRKPAEAHAQYEQQKAGLSEEEQKKLLPPQVLMVDYAEWYFAVDYTQLNLDKLSDVERLVNSQKHLLSSYSNTSFDIPMTSLIADFRIKEKNLNTTLTVLQIPIILMLGFYIFMLSQLIIEHDKNEISVLKSRGASKLQIIYVYLIQSVILVALAFLLGLPLAYFACKFLGTPEGFLDFANRTALNVALRNKAILFGAAAGLMTILTMLTPAFFAARVDIIEHKLKKTRQKRGAWWQKYFVDAILMCIAAYGYFTFDKRQSALITTGANAADIPIDPIIFIALICFLLGAGLFFMRIYPYILLGIFKLFRRNFKPAAFSSFIQIARAGSRNQFVSLFLILTMAIGLFSANAARTVNVAQKDYVNYSNAADVRLKTEFVTYGLSVDVGGYSYVIEPKGQAEPPFYMYKNLPGVEEGTKVANIKNVKMKRGTDFYTGTLMAIQPETFISVSWFRDDLNSYPMAAYTNLLRSDKRGVIISTKLKEKLNANVGDKLQFAFGQIKYTDCYVFAVVDYWPTINPNLEDQACFMIANFDYIQQTLGAAPQYEIWLKKKPNVQVSDLALQVGKLGYKLVAYEDRDYAMSQVQKSSVRLATNGALTLGFLVTLCICTVGFLIYWILSIKGRALQFGVLRAMGMTKSWVMRMLVYEQLLISGVAIFIGIIFGGIVSDLFIPFLQVVYSTAQQVPPFKIIMSPSDYIKIYVVVGFILAACFGLISAMISRIKAAQAIKLGED